jgi:hypothetical protein
MADNTRLDLGSGGNLMRTLDTGSVHWQADVLAYATTISDGGNVLQIVQQSTPLPVDIRGGNATVTVDLGDNNDVTVTSGAITETNSTAILADTASIDGKITACNTGAVVISSGTITAVTGITNTVTVDGAVAATQSGVWNITNISGTVSLPTGASTETTLDAVKTAVELIDNAIYVDDADWVDNTNSHMLIGGLYQSTPQSITDGKLGPIQLDANGRQLVKALNYDELVNGTITALNGTVTIAAANLGTAGIGISGTWVGTIVAEGDVGDGIWTTIPLIHSLTGAAVVSTAANGNWFIGLAGFVNVRIRASAWTSGTATVYLEGTSAPAGVFLNHSLPTGGNVIGQVLLTAGTNNVGEIDCVGNVADDAVDSGDPIKIGGYAVETDDTAPPAVSAEGDRAQANFDLNGRQLVNTRHPYGFSQNNEHTTAQTNAQVLAAPGADLHIYITDVVFSSAVAGEMRLVENTGTPVVKFGDIHLAANGGISKTFATPIRLSANVNLGLNTDITGDHTTHIAGYIGP